MNKIGILILLFASSLPAQVQIGKGVQIGGAGTGGGTVTAVSVATANGFQGTSSGSSSPILTLNVDSTHVLPVNTGGNTAFLNQAGGYLTIACATGLSCTVAGSTLTISLATAFTINSFTGGSTVELGYPVANPTFNATYSVTPASANITNTESISSPTNLTTPFTSGTITGTFVHASVTTTTFTLSATQGSTLTATQAINWQPAIFGGVGTAGATSSVTAAGTTAVLSNSNVLPRTQLGAEVVGQTFGSYSPTGQVIYLLLTGGSHTFKDPSTGFAFPFNAPITVPFLNANGVTVTMYLYASTYTQYGATSVEIAS
jgi:hypothetical protein